MTPRTTRTRTATQPRFFYGWYIVGVGILVNIAGTFAFSSALSIFHADPSAGLPSLCLSCRKSLDLQTHGLGVTLI